MNPGHYVSPRKDQEGATLLEALVGMLLMAVVGLGLSYATSRSLLSQRDLNTQNIMISQTREWLLTQGIAVACAENGTGLPITINGVSTTLSASCESNPIRISTAGNGGHDGHGGQGGQDGQGNGDSADLEVTLGADSIKTSVTAYTPSNADTQAMFGGDGKIGVSL